RHSEFNHDPDGETHFLQIWILPARRGIAPSYAQKTFAPLEKAGVLRLVASPDATQGSLQVHANAHMYAGCFEAGQSAYLALNPERKAYLQVVRGSVHGNGHFLDTGDALLLQAEAGLTLDQAQAAEVLVFDLES
ncbi:MAG: quercetin 2,3-dioxygenase, partial [Betaproteobacteria bacterium]|nr:quercetin 2,3-dioxygenase [Betaproteobacteria bacterium]